MASFTFDAGIRTVARSVICALRIRVSMSAMGSLMLMLHLSPAGLDDAGDLPAHRVLAQLVAAQAELAVIAARASRQGATVAQARLVGVARQRLQLQARSEAVLVGHLRVVDDRLQVLALLRELRDQLHALVLPVDQSQLGHGSLNS